MGKIMTPWREKRKDKSLFKTCSDINRLYLPKCFQCPKLFCKRCHQLTVRVNWYKLQEEDDDEDQEKKLSSLRPAGSLQEKNVIAERIF